MSRIDIFKKLVLNYYHENVAGGRTVTEDDVFVVWSCKTLQNFKAIIAVSFADERLFEVTYNGDKCETYLDVYEKKGKHIIGG